MHQVKPQRIKRKRRSFGFEKLEARRLLATDLIINVNDGSDSFEGHNSPSDSNIFVSTVTLNSSTISLREAIHLANNAPADRNVIINLQPGMEYRLGRARGWTVPSQDIFFDDLDIRRGMTINGNGASVVGGGGGAFDVFTSSSSFQLLVVNDLTIKNSTNYGMAVVGRFDVSLSNVSFINNRRLVADAANDQAGADARGAGLIVNANNANISPNVWIQGGVFQDNFTRGGKGGGADDGNDGKDGGEAFGAAIYASRANLTINGTSFINNRAAGNAGGFADDDNASGGRGGDSFGGAIFAMGSASLNIFEATFQSNRAGLGTASGGDADHGNGRGGQGGSAYGGAIYVGSGVGLVVRDSKFEQNLVNASTGGYGDSNNRSGNGGVAKGGAIYADFGATNLGLSNIEFTANRSVGGAGGTASFTGGGGNSGEGGAVWTAASGTWSGVKFLSNRALGGKGGNGQQGGQGGGGGLGAGGAVQITGASITLSDAEFESNEAVGGQSGEAGRDHPDPAGKGGLALGGAIRVFGSGTQIITGSETDPIVFKANYANGGMGALGSDGGDGKGGAIYADSNTDSITVTYGAFGGNAAQGGNGGNSRANTIVTPFGTFLGDIAEPGNNGAGMGGAIASGSKKLNLEDSLFLRNLANGFRTDGNPFFTGGRANAAETDGGDGGNAIGGAVHFFGKDLEVNNSILQNNQASGGNGSPGATPPERINAQGEIFNPGEVGDGEHGGTGGNGGSAYGGGLRAETNGAVTINGTAFVGNIALGGRGGKGGEGGNNSGDGNDGGGGGHGGHGGAAYGGGASIVNGATVTIDISTFQENRIAGGDGGRGGGGGIGSTGDTSINPFADKDGGDGGSGGNGGNGGRAYGGGLNLDNVAATISSSTFVNNSVAGGWGGWGGDGADASFATENWLNNTGILMGISDGTGGRGGNGGNGGNAGDAFGGGIALLSGSLSLTNSTVVGNQAITGYGGDGGIGGNGGPGNNGDDGDGGNAGNGGNGANAYGGGIYLAPGQATMLVGNTIAHNAVEAMAGGLGEFGGRAISDLADIGLRHRQRVFDLEGAYTWGSAASVFSAGSGAQSLEATATNAGLQLAVLGGIAVSVAAPTVLAVGVLSIGAGTVTLTAGSAVFAGLFAATFLGGLGVVALSVAAPIVIAAAVGVAVMGIALVGITIVQSILSNDWSGPWQDLGEWLISTDGHVGQYDYSLATLFDVSGIPARGQDGLDGSDGIGGRAEGAGVYIATGSAAVQMGRNLLADNQAGYRKQELYEDRTRIILSNSDVIFREKSEVKNHAPDVVGNVVSLGGNFISVNTETFGSQNSFANRVAQGFTSDDFQGTAFSPLDAKLDYHLHARGAATPTIGLAEDSPARNRVVGRDDVSQNGVPRPALDTSNQQPGVIQLPNMVDIGAFEYVAPPNAVNDTYLGFKDMPVVASSQSGVLANDSLSGETLKAYLITPPTRGTVTLNEDGSFRYLMNAEEVEWETDSFTYYSVGGGNGAFATVTINFVIPNDDITPPSSRVDALPAIATEKSFVVSISGQDNRPLDPHEQISGVKQYDVYVATGRGAFQLWKTLTTESPAAVFDGTSGNTYFFRSVATDIFNNVESKAVGPEAVITVPDLDAPLAQITQIDSSTSEFEISFTAADQLSGLKSVEVFVSVDDSELVSIGKITAPLRPPGTPFTGSVKYQAIADGNSHGYTFWIIGTDFRGNQNQLNFEDWTSTFVEATFAAPPALEVIKSEVNQGAKQRSYIPTLDLTFNTTDGLAELLNGNHFTVTRFPANGVGAGEEIEFYTQQNGNKVTLNFGSEGIGYDRDSAIGDGNYLLEVDLDADELVDYSYVFHRLFGDADGDGDVDRDDLNVITLATRTQNPDGDIDGSGRVQVLDRSLAQRQLGKRITPVTILNSVSSTSSSIQRSSALMTEGEPSSEMSPWQNLVKPIDVNVDGASTPMDALLIINKLNVQAAMGEPENHDVASGDLETEMFWDVNGDLLLSPMDALLVINSLNQASGSEIPQAPVPSGLPAAFLVSDRDDAEPEETEVHDHVFATW